MNKTLKSGLVLLFIVNIFGSGVMGDESSIKKEIVISTYSAGPQTQMVIEQEQKRKKALETMKQEHDERVKQIKKELSKIIEDVRLWIKENEFPAYQGEVFWNLAKVDDDPRVFELYCEVIENSGNLMSRLFAIRGLKHINKKTAIPILKKSLSDESIAIRHAVADILFDWKEKDSAYSTYIEILTIKNLENQLDKEIPEIMKLGGYYGTRSHPTWSSKFNKTKETIVRSMIEKLLQSDDPNSLKIIKNILTQYNFHILEGLEEDVNMASKNYEESKEKLISQNNQEETKRYSKVLEYKKEQIEKMKNLLKRLETIINE